MKDLNKLVEKKLNEKKEQLENEEISKIEPKKINDIVNDVKDSKIQIVYYNGMPIGFTDKKFYKVVEFKGVGVACCYGNTEEELEADVKAAKETYQAMGCNKIYSNIKFAETAVEYEKESKSETKSIELNGKLYIIDYTRKILLNSDNIIADLSDLSEKVLSKLDNDDIEELLINKLNK